MKQLAALIVLALVVAGCGAAPQDSAEQFDGTERLVATAIETLESTARDDEPGRICAELLADTLIETLAAQGTNCRTAVREALADTDSFALSVDEVTIRGDKATAEVTSGQGSDEKTDTLALELDGDSWKIASLGP